MIATSTYSQALHPIIAQALLPAMPRYYYGGQTYICERTMREDMKRDANALRLQMQSDNTRTNFGEAV